MLWNQKNGRLEITICTLHMLQMLSHGPAAPVRNLKFPRTKGRPRVLEPSYRRLAPMTWPYASPRLHLTPKDFLSLLRLYLSRP